MWPRIIRWVFEVGRDKIHNFLYEIMGLKVKYKIQPRASKDYRRFLTPSVARVFSRPYLYRLEIAAAVKTIIKGANQR